MKITEIRQSQSGVEWECVAFTSGVVPPPSSPRIFPFSLFLFLSLSFIIHFSELVFFRPPRSFPLYQLTSNLMQMAGSLLYSRKTCSILSQ